jgi:type II secretory pathway pseudopilin PulG
MDGPTRTTERRRGYRQRGFAYLVLLLWVAIGGALLAALSSHWSFESRREREAEFVFRAEQYRLAIESYASPVNANGCASVQQLPPRLEDLLEDRRCGMVRRHLRRLYPDPVSRSSEWGLVTQLGGISGVYGLSDAPLVRRVEGVKTYRDWRFMANVGTLVPREPGSAVSR